MGEAGGVLEVAGVMEGDGLAVVEALMVKRPVGVTADDNVEEGALICVVRWDGCGMGSGSFVWLEIAQAFRKMRKRAARIQARLL